MKKVARALMLMAGIMAGAPDVSQAISCHTVGNTLPALTSIDCTLTLTSDPAGVDSLAISIHNTSSFDARVTSFGFDFPVDVAENYTGLQGSVISGPIVGAPAFTFKNTDQPNVAQFSAAVLDISFVTGPNFNGGSPNSGIPVSTTVNFSITGELGSLTEAVIADALFVRFQRVGDDGEGSDVGNCCTTVPEPGTLLLLGGGFVALGARVARRRVGS